MARQESFELLSHGAQDIRACIKDVSRVERFVYDRPGADGAVVVLTNDSNYWTPRTHGRITLQPRPARSYTQTLVSRATAGVIQPKSEEDPP